MKNRIVKHYTIGSILILSNLILYFFAGYELYDFLLHETAFNLIERIIPVAITFIPMTIGFLRIRKAWRIQKGIEVDANSLIDSLPGE